MAQADGESGGCLTEFRRAFQFAGRPALDLARKPNHGAPPEEIQTGYRTVCGRYRLPASSRVGPLLDAHPQQLAVGDATSLPLVYRSNRNRQIVVGTGPGAEGLPGRVQRVVPAASETISGADGCACRWQPGPRVGNHRPR